MSNKGCFAVKGYFIALTFALISLGANVANASHFRFSHFTYEARPDISPSTADFNLTVAFRSSYFGNPAIGQTFRPGSFTFGDGASASFNFEVIARNTQEDWIVGRAVQPGNESGLVRHTYPSPQNNGEPWVASFTGCCRIGALRNGSGSWKVLTEVDLAGSNKSPVSNLPPIVTCSKYDCRFLIPAVDRNGDSLHWRMSTRAESGITSIPAGMGVDSAAGLFTWEDSESFSNGLYAVQVMIEDHDENGGKKSSVAIDFIVNLQENGANARPVFDSPPTPLPGSTIIAVVGQTLTQIVQATDPDVADEVFLNHVGLPAYASFEQVAVGGATGQATLEWTPTAADIGKHIVTFLANDNRGGASSPVAVTIDVIEPAISNVRIIDTISTEDITIDVSAFATAPQHVDVQDGQTIVTWHFPTFNVGQLENLTAELALFDVTPNEQRLVSHSVDVYYNDVNGEEIHQTLPEMTVKIAPTLTGVNITTDKTTYGPGEQVILSSTVSNLSDIPTDANVVVSILDNRQNLAGQYGTFRFDAIPSHETVALDDLYFETAGVYVGMYEAVATIIDDAGKVLRRSSTPFSIVTESGTLLDLGSTVYTDKPVYQAWDQVIIDARAHNLATNSSFNGGQGVLTVTNSAGETIHQQSIGVSSLAPSAITTTQIQLPLSDSSAGIFQVVWTVSSGDETLTSSQATFEVTRSELQALLGEVEVTHYETGEPKSCEFSTSNRSSNETVNANLTYQVITLSDGELINEILEKDISVKNTENHLLQILITDDLPDYGGYACVLLAEIDGEMQELAATGFYLHPPQLTPNLSVGTRGQLLVLVDDLAYQAPHDMSRPAEQIDYLNQLLTANAWHYTLVDTAEEFTAEFYSGHYSAIALLSEQVGLHPQVERLLVEAHNNGVGILVGGAWNRRNNKIERGLGIYLNGRNSAASSILLSDGVLPETEYLDGMVDQGVAFGHCGSQVWAIFSDGNSASSKCATNTGPAAVTAGSYGNGKNVYFGYDILDVATLSGSLHEELLLHALQHIQPYQWNTYPGHTVPVVISVENASRAASLDVTSKISNGGVITESRYLMQLTAENTEALWQWDFARPGEVANTLYIKLPESPSSVGVDVDVSAGISRRLMMDYAEMKLVIEMSEEGPVAQVATELVGELLSNGAGNANYKFVQKKLQKALGDISKQRFDKAIQSLLLAADELAEDSDAQAQKARLALDELLYQIQRQL